MFKKLLHKIGIGSASCNLVLNQQQLRVGEQVTGTVMVKGGSDTTKIDAVFVDLVLKSHIGEGDEREELEKVVHTVTIATDLSVEAGEEMSFPLRTVVPNLPQSSHYVAYAFTTRLDIPGAIDKYDFDDVLVLPAAPLAVIHETVRGLGFSETEEFGEFDGYHQKFEYKPMGGEFYGHVNELEFIAVLEENGVRLFMEVDRRAHGVAGFFGGEIEQKSSVFLYYGLLESREETRNALHDFLHAELSRYGARY